MPNLFRSCLIALVLCLWGTNAAYAGFHIKTKAAAARTSITSKAAAKEEQTTRPFESHHRFSGLLRSIKSAVFPAPGREHGGAGRTSLTLALVGLIPFLLGAPGIPAVIFGIIGLARPGSSNKGSAVAGLVLGLFESSVFLLLMALMLAF